MKEFQGLERKQIAAGLNIFCFTDQQQDQLSGHGTHFCVIDGCIVGHISSFAKMICLNCLKWTGVEMKYPNCSCVKEASQIAVYNYTKCVFTYFCYLTKHRAGAPSQQTL